VSGDTSPIPLALTARSSSDESQTNEEATGLVVVEETERPPCQALDLDRLAAMLDALDGLIRSALIPHARSVLGEASTWSHGPANEKQ
jgi:activator of HSP90 ATPase